MPSSSPFTCGVYRLSAYSRGDARHFARHRPESGAGKHSCEVVRRKCPSGSALRSLHGTALRIRLAGTNVHGHAADETFGSSSFFSSAAAIISCPGAPGERIALQVRALDRLLLLAAMKEREVLDSGEAVVGPRATSGRQSEGQLVLAPRIKARVKLIGVRQLLLLGERLQCRRSHSSMRWLRPASLLETVPSFTGLAGRGSPGALGLADAFGQAVPMFLMKLSAVVPPASFMPSSTETTVGFHGHVVVEAARVCSEWYARQHRNCGTRTSIPGKEHSETLRSSWSGGVVR